MLQLLILDVEGVITLPGGGQYPWPLEDLLAVRTFLKSAPLAAVLCTGRQQPYGEAVIQALDLFTRLPEVVAARVREQGGPELTAWPSIMENGAYFYDPLAKRPIPHPDLTPERVRRLHRLRSEVLVPLASRTGAVVEAGKDFSASVNPPPLAPGSAERQPVDEFGAEVRAALGEFAEDVEVKCSASAVDITPAGISKASAVRRLLEWTGLSPAEVLGVGDTRADEAWLAEVGWGATPANGRANLPGLDFYAPGEVAAGLLQILQNAAAHHYEQIGGG